jgi:hypothetical protein|tara:strand:+ start:263 stop:622 length:360 start_codon:yes stop_codon:yes gene_type:complete
MSNTQTMQTKSPIRNISTEQWNYGKKILQGMKFDDVIVYSKKKWIIKNNKTEFEGLLVYMLKYEYNEDDEKVLYKVIALIDDTKKNHHYKNRLIFPMCDYINRKPSSILSKTETTIEQE